MGYYWTGTMLVAHGEDFVRRFAQQKVQVHQVSGMTLLDMVIAGEYEFSPTLFDSHVLKTKKKGAPVGWLPLEPVHVNIGQMALSKHAPNPHAALLFIDVELSKTSAEIHKAAGYAPTRKDVSGVKTYKKFYGIKSLEEAKEWINLYEQVFMNR